MCRQWQLLEQQSLLWPWALPGLRGKQSAHLVQSAAFGCVNCLVFARAQRACLARRVPCGMAYISLAVYALEVAVQMRVRNTVSCA